MKTIGLIGLGAVGMPMAEVLLKAGHEVVGFRRGEASDFKAVGGRVAASPRAVAESADLVICCIPSEQALREVISGPQGIASGDCSGRLVLELSTLSADAKAQQAELLVARGGMMLDGAISGLPPMVAARKAIFLLSGDDTAFAEAKPILDTLTEHLFFMGAFGDAMKTKLCANLLVAINIAATAETLAFGTKMGLDPSKLVAALRNGAGTSLQFQARADRMVRGDWHEVLGSIAMLTKDIRLIEEAGARFDCLIPVLSSAARVYERAIEEGHGETDGASVYATYAAAAGLAVPFEQ